MGRQRTWQTAGDDTQSPDDTESDDLPSPDDSGGVRTVADLDGPRRLIRLPDVTATTAGSRSGRVASALLAAFSDRVEKVVADAWLRVAELSGYRNLGDGQARAVRADMGEVIATFVACLREDRGLDAADVARLRELGARRAVSSISVETLEEAWHLTYDVAQLELDRIVHDHPDPSAGEVGHTLNTRLLRLLPDALQATRAGHRAAVAGRQLPDHLERCNGVGDLLDGHIDPRAAVDRLARLGVPTDGAWRPAVMVAAHGSPTELGRALDAATAGPVDVIIGPLSDRPVVHAVMLTAVRSDDVPSPGGRLASIVDRHDVTAVVARPGHLELAVATCRRLVDHLDVTARLADPPAVLSAWRLVHYATLAAMPVDDAAWLVADVLAPLLEPSDRRWDPLPSLHAVHDADGDLEAAADALGLAGRTVRDHLRRTADLLEVDHDGTVVVGGDVGTALDLLRVHAHALHPPGDPAWAALRRYPS